MDTGRTIIWHRVRQAEAQGPSSFAYVIDPAGWIAPDRFMHTDIDSLNISWYMAVAPAKTSGAPAVASADPAKTDRRIK